MSDPIAASIVAKVDHWWPLDGNLNDAAGDCDLTIGTNVAGYAAGKKGQMLLKGSRGAGSLLNPFQLTTDNAMTIGGWVYYDGTPAALNLFGLSFDFNGQNTAFSLSVTITGAVHAGCFPTGSSDQYLVEVPGFTVKSYPVTVRVVDTKGNSRSSAQTILIGGSDIESGFYFLTARFIGDVIEVYLAGTFVGATTPPMPTPRTTPITYFQIGQQFGNTNTNCGLDELFFARALLTPEEIAYLYNGGVGRSYAELKALAA